MEYYQIGYDTIGTFIILLLITVIVTYLAFRRRSVTVEWPQNQGEVLVDRRPAINKNPTPVAYNVRPPVTNVRSPVVLDRTPPRRGLEPRQEHYVLASKIPAERKSRRYICGYCGHDLMEGVTESIVFTVDGAKSVLYCPVCHKRLTGLLDVEVKRQGKRLGEDRLIYIRKRKRQLDEALKKFEEEVEKNVEEIEKTRKKRKRKAEEKVEEEEVQKEVEKPTETAEEESEVTENKTEQEVDEMEELQKLIEKHKEEIKEEYDLVPIEVPEVGPDNPVPEEIETVKVEEPKVVKEEKDVNLPLEDYLYCRSCPHLRGNGEFTCPVKGKYADPDARICKYRIVELATGRPLEEIVKDLA